MARDLLGSWRIAFKAVGGGILFGGSIFLAIHLLTR
jgi:hypothetical protein